MSPRTIERELDDLLLHLKGLVHGRDRTAPRPARTLAKDSGDRYGAAA